MASVSNYPFQDKETERKKREEKERRERVERELKEHVERVLKEHVERVLKEHVERVLKEVEERERKERQERDLKEHVERVLKEVEERERKERQERDLKEHVERVLRELEERERKERQERDLKEHVERVLRELEERERKERQERDLKEHVQRVLREVEERKRKEREEIERKEREELERKELEETQRKEHEERERERVTNDILRLQNEMEVEARAHYLCAEYYGKWKFILFVSLLIFGGALAGYRAPFLDWKVPLLGDPWSKKTAIAVFALGVVTFVIRKCHNAVADSHEKHYNAERNCQRIVEKARSLSQRGFSGESASSLRDNYDRLLREKESFNEIRPEKWAYQNASKK